MKYDDIRGILRYVPQFRGQTFVVLIDSALIDHENLGNVLLDLAVLHSLSIRVVVAFGARQQILNLATRRGIPLTSPDATGVTDEATLDASIDAISRLSTVMLQHLNSVGLRTAISNAVSVHPAGVIRGRDLGYTGTIDRIDTQMLQQLIDQGIIPLVPPSGGERPGRTLRLNSAAVAVEVAVALQAAKLLFVGAGVVESPGGQRIRQLSVDEAKTMSAKSKQPAESESSHVLLLRHAARACEGGVQRVHFLDGRTDDALLGELFSLEGVGTMVYRDAYQQIRPARRSDIDNIVRMVRTAVDDDELVARSRQEIRTSIDSYHVIEVDGTVVGVVAVNPWPEHAMAEIGCLYVRKSHEGMGFGRTLVQFAERRAAELGFRTVFALSTQAYNFFEQKLGYQIVSPDRLPPARREKLLRSGRNSRVLLREISPQPTPEASAS
jgi:amino-acid N-acetyltransferase